MPRLRSTVRDRFPAPDTQGKYLLGRDSKAVMQRIANPSSPVRLRVAPPQFAGIAQLVERNLAKVEVDGSRPFSRSNEKGKPKASLFSLHAQRRSLAPKKSVKLGRLRSPGGGIGRHRGLKIRCFLDKGRAGSIPARGTNLYRKPTSSHRACGFFSGHSRCACEKSSSFLFLHRFVC